MGDGEFTSGSCDTSTRQKQVKILGLGGAAKQRKALRNFCNESSSIAIVAIEFILLLQLPITAKSLIPTHHFFLQFSTSCSLHLPLLHL